MSPRAYSGGYTDSKDRFRPITPRKKTSKAKTGAPIRVKKKKPSRKEKPKSGNRKKLELQYIDAYKDKYGTWEGVNIDGMRSMTDSELRKSTQSLTKHKAKPTVKSERVDQLLNRKRTPDYMALNFYARPDSNLPEMTLYLVGGVWKDHRGRKYTNAEVKAKVKGYRRGFGVVEAGKILGHGGERRNVRAFGEEVYVSITSTMPSRHQAEKVRDIVGPYDTKVVRLPNGRYQVFANYQQALKADAVERSTEMDKYSGNLRRLRQTGTARILVGLDRQKRDFKSAGKGLQHGWEKSGHRPATSKSVGVNARELEGWGLMTIIVPSKEHPGKYIVYTRKHKGRWPSPSIKVPGETTIMWNNQKYDWDSIQKKWYLR